MMTRFKSLTIHNFKRFSGNHVIPLDGDGQVNVIAAQNGIGKTTILDAINIAFHGKRAFRERYPGRKFAEWLHNAYSVDAEDSDYPEISFAIDIDDPQLGGVRIQRIYWLLSENDGGFNEELTIYSGGKPLELEVGENKIEFSEAWIEAFFSRPIARRFFVDGERLSEFDTINIDKEMIESIDDLLDIGLLKKLNLHLIAIERDTVRKLVPQNEINTLDNLYLVLDEYEGEVNELESQILEKRSEQTQVESRISELNQLFENESVEEEGEVANLRIQFAITQSELTNMRKEVLELMTDALPFLVAGIPENLDIWQFEGVHEALESEKLNSENLKFIYSVLQTVEPPIDDEIKNQIRKHAVEISESDISSEIDSPLAYLGQRGFSDFQLAYSEHNLSDARDDATYIIDKAKMKLDAFKKTSKELRQATQGLSIQALAKELRANGMALGGLQAELKHKESELENKRLSISEVKKQIIRLEGRSNSDSLLNRKKKLLIMLKSLAQEYSVSHRANLAIPLQAAFEEGFKLLSRKSDRIQSISISPDNYQTEIQMRQFNGNWLERDLSATEKQHVGLSLLYALRKVGNKPFPVVIDTPTSRMDSQHKAWSVTKFYPALSHQVIVLATSDDLSEGLYDELKASGAIGRELVITERTENSVEVKETLLSEFFGNGGE